MAINLIRCQGITGLAIASDGNSQGSGRSAGFDAMRRHHGLNGGGAPMTERDPLSMSTDNTPEGQMYSDTVEGGPISQVEIGDTVVDSTGKEVGTVKFVKMGDSNAVT